MDHESSNKNDANEEVETGTTPVADEKNTAADTTPVVQSPSKREAVEADDDEDKPREISLSELNKSDHIERPKLK